MNYAIRQHRQQRLHNNSSVSFRCFALSNTLRIVNEKSPSLASIKYTTNKDCGAYNVVTSSGVSERASERACARVWQRCLTHSSCHVISPALIPYLCCAVYANRYVCILYLILSYWHSVGRSINYSRRVFNPRAHEHALDASPIKYLFTFMLYLSVYLFLRFTPLIRFAFAFLDSSFSPFLIPIFSTRSVQLV